MSSGSTPLADELRRALEERNWDIVERLPAVSTHSVVRIVDRVGKTLIVKYSEEADALESEFRALNAFGPEVSATAELISSRLLVLEDLGGTSLADLARAGETTSLTDPIVDLLYRMRVDAPKHARQLSRHVEERTEMLRGRLQGPARRLLEQSTLTLDETEPDALRLVHGDLHPGNVLVNQHRDRLRIIDPYGVRGDPTYDAAMLCIYLPHGADLFSRVADTSNARAVAWFDWMLANRYDNASRHLGPQDPVTMHLERQISERGR